MTRYQSRYSGDPGWIKARHAGRCSGDQCQQAINRGDRVWSYPLTQPVYAVTCGHAEANAGDFTAASLDEESGG
jgi:hypothetical protein